MNRQQASVKTGLLPETLYLSERNLQIEPPLNLAFDSVHNHFVLQSTHRESRTDIF